MKATAISGARIAAAAALLGLGTLLGVVLARAATQPPAPRYSIENSAKSFAMDGVEKTKAGYKYWFFDKTFAEGRSIKLSVVAPHQKSHDPHRHDGHEFFFVLEGKAAFFLEGETKVVGPQTALYCPPQSLHGISNAGDAELKYLVIKDYPWPPEPTAAAPAAPATTAAARP
jgi:mannose-6-phosphate isomerase-like protein (cupin superfamily)